MINWHRIVGTSYRKTESLLRPFLFGREKRRVLKRYPALRPVMEAFERHYIRVEYGAHDRSLMERIQRQLTEDDAYVYGSTPWTAFLQIADVLDVQPTDVFIEPGCGTGHLCFLMNQVYGIRAQGIEVIANFVTTANAIRTELSGPPHGLQLDQLKFYNLDFFSCDLSRGTLFYVAGTCFPEDYRQRLLDKIVAEAPPGARLITLTHPLEDARFQLQHRVDTLFSWGRDKALIYRIHPEESPL